MNTIVSVNKSFFQKSFDYLLYFSIFGGISLISGAMVHALSYSLYNIFLLLIGLFLTSWGILTREKSLVKKTLKKEDYEKILVSVATSISAGCITGGILHWEENPVFGLYLVLAGFSFASISTILYSTKGVKETIMYFMLNLAIFSGISLVSGSVVHAINDWFNNFFLLFFGAVLTPIAMYIKSKIFDKGNKSSNLKHFIIIFVLSLGIGAITGGINHFTANPFFSSILIFIGFLISFFVSLFNTEKSLVDLRQ